MNQPFEDIHEFCRSRNWNYNLINPKTLDAPWNKFNYIVQQAYPPHITQAPPVSLIVLVDEEVYSRALENNNLWNQTASLFQKYRNEDSWWMDSGNLIYCGKKVYRIIELYVDSGMPDPVFFNFLTELQEVMPLLKVG